MRSGYWQVAAEAWPKTAFTIGQGLWQFRVMPFGLCNAPATLMLRVLQPFCATDVFEGLTRGFRMIERHYFQGCQWLTCGRFSPPSGAPGCGSNRRIATCSVEQTAFLGHVVSAQGVAIDPAKVGSGRHPPPSVSCGVPCGWPLTTIA